jgi:CRISPR/Cas system-associated exonuclease Cas4 (RecB family)
MRAVYILQEFLLESGSWSKKDGGDLNSSVYAYCLNQLSELGEAVRSCGFTTTQAVMSLFVQFLGKQQYIPKDRPPGIPVFSYTVSAGLSPKYHFLLGCTQEDIEQHMDQLPLVPEPIWRDDAANDHTSLFLDQYRVLAQEIHISAAQATFGNSSALAPSWFIDHDAVAMQRYVPTDLRTREQAAWATADATQLRADAMQSRWFDQACRTAFLPPRFDMADNKAVFSVWDRSCKGTTYLSLSATAFDMFYDCPMKWASSYLMHLRKGTFDPVSLDHSTVGILLHEILARFFQRVREDSGVFRKELVERYEVLLTSSIDEVFTRFAHSPQAPVQTTVHYIAERYGAELMAILNAESDMFDGFTSWGFEVSLEHLYAQSSCLLNGRIDRILVHEHPDGTQTVAVVDYKKTYRGSKKAYDNYEQCLPSHQLPLYAKLIRDTDSTGLRQVETAAFYSIEKGKYIPVWEESQEERRDGMIAVLEEHMLHMTNALRQGRLGATPSKEACANCDYRQICRRRYALV